MPDAAGHAAFEVSLAAVPERRRLRSMRKAPAQTQGPALHALLPGLLLVAALGALATSLGELAPVIGAPVIAILLGVALRLTLDPGHWAAHGIAVGARVPLQGAIVLLGAGLSLGAVVRVGAGTAHSLNQLALFLIAVALAAIGLSTQPRELAATGPRPLLLGLILWLAVASSSLLLQALTGQLRTS